MAAQVWGFIVELVYLVGLLMIRLAGRRLFPAYILDITNMIKFTQFGVTSTVQILVSPELRRKLKAFLLRN